MLLCWPTTLIGKYCASSFQSKGMPSCLGRILPSIQNSRILCVCHKLKNRRIWVNKFHERTQNHHSPSCRFDILIRIDINFLETTPVLFLQFSWNPINYLAPKCLPGLSCCYSSILLFSYPFSTSWSTIYIHHLIPSPPPPIPSFFSSSFIS